MKNAIAILVCIALGIGIGWYCERMRSAVQAQRDFEVFKEEYLAKFNVELGTFDKFREEEFNKAAPWEASSASIALAALKNLDANDVQGARLRLASIAAVYYRGHSHDGDTNLITSLVTFAATDTVLSNALYRKLP
jgi:hypothetical protein